MAAVKEFQVDQTVAFRPSADWAGERRADESVHFLLLLEDNAAPQRIALVHLPMTIGRAPPAEIVLTGSTVSRRHCRLDQHEDRILVTDLGSTNGTFVDGTRIAEAAVLADGAVLNVGAYRLRYQRRSADEAAETEAMERELQDAADYVASILPPPLTEGPVLAEWYFQPCARLGGDAFGYQMLDSQHFAAFLLDVAGHGTAAALHSVSVVNVLRQRMLPDADFRDPGTVIRSLNRRFTMDQHNALFFTIWYGVYDLETRALTYASGGHHPAWLVKPSAPQAVALGTRNPSIGIVPDRDVETARAIIPPGSALHLFSDGVFEIVDRDGRQWDLAQVLALLPNASVSGGPRLLYDQVRAAARVGPLEDDFSALLLRFP
jgi:serine phosphatase RsbU (regulator of sigma subunit)